MFNNAIIFSGRDIRYQFSGKEESICLSFKSKNEIIISEGSPQARCLRAIALWLRYEIPVSAEPIDDTVSELLHIMFLDASVSIDITSSRRMENLQREFGRQMAITLRAEAVGTLYCIMNYDGNQWQLDRIET
jgi:hypothetical protein